MALRTVKSERGVAKTLLQHEQEPGYRRENLRLDLRITPLSREFERELNAPGVAWDQVCASLLTEVKRRTKLC